MEESMTTKLSITKNKSKETQNTSVIEKIKKSPWSALAAKLLITIVIILGLLKFVIGINIYYGNNMFPAMNDGTLIITYKLNKNIYSELIVAYNVNDKTRFGRIVGVPGDIIYLDDTGKFTINGNIVSENNIFYNTFEGEGVIYPYTVPENSYFILNDYRENTEDSRTYGAINKKDIAGQVYLELQRRGF